MDLGEQQKNDYIFMELVHKSRSSVCYIALVEGFVLDRTVASILSA